MKLNVCLRCHSKFYKASLDSGARCPVCDYTNLNNERRGRNRVELSRNCDVFMDEVRFTAKTINISVDGLALELKRDTRFKVKEQVRVCVHDFDIEIFSAVAWVTSLDSTYISMGLRFNDR